MAIDAAIGSLMPERPAALRSSLPFVAANTVTDMPTPSLRPGESTKGANLCPCPDYDHPRRTGISASSLATLMAITATASRVLEGRSTPNRGHGGLLKIGGDPIECPEGDATTIPGNEWHRRSR